MLTVLTSSAVFVVEHSRVQCVCVLLTTPTSCSLQQTPMTTVGHRRLSCSLQTDTTISSTKVSNVQHSILKRRVSGKTSAPPCFPSRGILKRRDSLNLGRFGSAQTEPLPHRRDIQPPSRYHILDGTSSDSTYSRGLCAFGDEFSGTPSLETSPPEQVIRVIVDTLHGESFRFRCPVTVSGRELKGRIEEKGRISCSRQCLMYKSQWLSDRATPFAELSSDSSPDDGRTRSTRIWGVERVHLFVLPFSPSREDQINKDPLHLAVSTGRRDSASLVLGMLQCGADPSTADEDGWSALHEASAQGDKEVVTALVAAGAAVNATERSGGSTPLHAAAATGHVSVIEALVHGGAAVNATARNGCTPLHAAVRCADSSSVKMLLDSGADFVGVERGALVSGSCGPFRFRNPSALFRVV